MNVSNRDEVITAIDAATTPSEEEQQQAKAQFDSDQAFKESQTNALNGQANESNGRADKSRAEVRSMPSDKITDRIKAISGLDLDDDDDKAFERRLAILPHLLNEKKLGLDLNASSLNQQE